MVRYNFWLISSWLTWIYLSTSVPRYIWNIFYVGAESILKITILNSNVRIFGSFDVPGLNVLTFLTYRSFAYFLWCQYVVGWRKMRHSLTFYFVDSLLGCNVSCYICLSWGTECRGLKVSMKTKKAGVQRIKINSQFMYGKENEETCHSLWIIHHYPMQLMNFLFMCSNIPVAPTYVVHTIFLGFVVPIMISLIEDSWKQRIFWTKVS